MTTQSLIRSTKALLNDSGEIGRRWEKHLKNLQAHRDMLAGDLRRANDAIAQHVLRKEEWMQYVASLEADEEPK